MADDTFSYLNKRTNKVEQRPKEPTWYQKAYENMAYHSDVNDAREAAKKRDADLASPDKSSTIGR